MTTRRLMGIVFALGLFAVANPASAVAPQEPHGEAGHGDQGDEHGQPAEHGDAQGGGHAAGGGLNFADFGYRDAHKDPPLILALINFGLLLALLGWKLAPALREYWAKKSDTIRDGLEEGARLRKEAEAKLEEYGQRIKDVEREVDELISDIRAEAEEEKKQLFADAEAQAAATKKAAEERITAELAQAKRTIEREVVEAAVKAAEKLLRDNVGAGDQQKLVDGFIASLSTRTPMSKSGGPS